MFKDQSFRLNPRKYTQSHNPNVVQWPRMGTRGGEVVGLGSPSWSPSWILSRIKNQIKTMRINHFLRLKLHVINNSFASFKPQVLLLFLKEVERTCIFPQKMA